MDISQHTLSIHHRHANGDGVVETITEQVPAAELDTALKHANTRLANAQCRNFGCRIELDGQEILYTLVRSNCPNPGPVRFCRHDADAIAAERNATLAYETRWQVSRDLRPVARTATGRGRGAR